MEFDIHQRIVDPDTDAYDEDAATRYEERHLVLSEGVWL